MYRSDLADRLPDALSMPRALAVIDVDELSSAIWLEEVPRCDWPWDTERFTRAAYLLGRLAGSSPVAPLAQIDDHQWAVRDYLHGRLEHQAVPMLHDDELWAHPLLANAFGNGRRDRMRDALDAVPAWIEELADAPHLLHMMVFTGLSSMPFEHLGAPPSPRLDRLAAARAAVTTYCLDQIEATQAPTRK